MVPHISAICLHFKCSNQLTHAITNAYVLCHKPSNPPDQQKTNYSSMRAFRHKHTGTGAKTDTEEHNL